MEAPPPPPPELVPPPPDDAYLPPPPPSEIPPPPPDTKTVTIPKVKKQPLDIDELLRKKAQDAGNKPRFIPKAERERLAMEKRKKEVEQQQRSRDAARIDKYSSSTSNRKNGVNGHNAPPVTRMPSGPKAMRNGEIPTGPAAMRNSQSSSYRDKPPPPAPSTKSTVNAGLKRQLPQDEAIAAQNRQRYMGPEQKTSKFSALNKRKRADGKKFNMGWNEKEDTSLDFDPIYKQQLEPKFYGAGALGGFSDDVKQKNTRDYANAIRAQDPETGEARAAEILARAERMRVEGFRNGIDVHWSKKHLNQMRERDWRIFKEDFNISTKGGSMPNPMRSWSESGLPKSLLNIVEQVGYDDPTAVQRAAIPIALQSRDLIGVAVTGSGKTAAFLLPLLVYIDALPKIDDFNKNDGPYAIVLAPTRELAQQIEIEAKKFATPLGFTCVSIVGGHSIEEQAYNMRDGAEIIIATPGRLVDCIERRVLVLSQCCYIIMDEADRMIDLGFEESVNKILDALPVSNEKPDTEDAENPQAMSQVIGGRDRYRQTMMYTATMPSAIERIARKYLRRPAIVTIGNVGEAVDTVEQRVEFIAGEDKRKKRLNELLTNRQEFKPPIIVFVNIKRNCDAVAKDVRNMGINAVTLHGGKTQDQRELALGALRDGKADVLVATDLAGRGIDVPDVSLVVNFNMATNIESYTHRIGRTGRAGKTGVAITFLGNEDTDVMYDLKQMLQKSERSRVPEELRRHEAAQQKRIPGSAREKKGGDEKSSGF